MGCSYDSSFWGEVLCDNSENNDCWLSKCDECREWKKFSLRKRMDSLTIYKQWKTILVPANRKGNQNDENEEPQTFFEKLQIISEKVIVSEIYEDFQQSFQDVTDHVNLKRIQARAFQEDNQCQQQSDLWPISANNKVITPFA